MKKRWRVAALGICMAMLTCACSTQTEKADTSSTQQNGEKKETAEEKAEKAKQAKLDLIDPAAYGNVDGLELEKGTYLVKAVLRPIGKRSKQVPRTQLLI